MFYPTYVDVMTFVGTFGLFMTLFLLFMRFLPMFAMAELKAVLPKASPHIHDDESGVRAYAMYASPLQTDVLKEAH